MHRILPHDQRSSKASQCYTQMTQHRADRFRTVKRHLGSAARVVQRVATWAAAEQHTALSTRSAGVHEKAACNRARQGLGLKHVHGRLKNGRVIQQPHYRPPMILQQACITLAVRASLQKVHCLLLAVVAVRVGAATVAVVDKARGRHPEGAVVVVARGLAVEVAGAV